MTVGLNIVTGEEHFKRGFALHQAGKYAEAEQAYWMAVKYQPDHVEAWHCLGLIAHHVGRNDLAAEFLIKARGFKPNDPFIHNNLGEVFRALGRGGDAMDSYNKAIEISPEIAVFYNNLGIVQAHLGRMDDAAANWEKAIKLQPNYPEPHNNIGNVYLEQSMIDEAVEAHRNAVKLGPSYTAAHSNLLRDLNHLAVLDGVAILKEHEQWWEQQAAGIKPVTDHKNAPDPEKKLRVGFVSPDLREHSVGFFLEAILARHDPAKMEYTCYANVTNPDFFTERLHRTAERWRNVMGTTDEELAQMVLKDEIDIFVDLAGHTAQNRVRAFAYKPAPVQVTYLGYPMTTGGSIIDWKLTDAHSDPVGMTEKYNAEKLWRLPRTAWCYRPPTETPPVAELPANKNGYVTFGSFNNFAKVSPPVVRMWADILKRVPTSKLLLKANGLANPGTQKRIYERFAKHGIPAERLALFGKEPSTIQHLARYGEVDIGLDTYPYDGTTTTCEAMWMGIPVITLAGHIHISRVGVSLLTNVGLPELIANTEEEYVEKAVALAGQLEKVAEWRRGLRERMKKSPLMDEAGFVKEMEEALRGMWREWCAKGGR